LQPFPRKSKVQNAYRLHAASKTHLLQPTLLHARAQGVNGEPETGGRKKIGAFLVQNQLQVR
jgi:hypothetical protein